jgi:CheY-like chemotaxis protein
MAPLTEQYRTRPVQRCDMSEEKGPTTGAQKTQSAVPRRRILVVDDNVDSAESLAVLLRLVGHEARTVFDGRQVLAAVEDYRPELVLLDIGLPGIDGYELARRLRLEPWAGQTKLVALTGYATEEDRSKAQAAGFDHHLVKPVDFQSLYRLVEGLGATKE